MLMNKIIKEKRTKRKAEDFKFSDDKNEKNKINILFNFMSLQAEQVLNAVKMMMTILIREIEADLLSKKLILINFNSQLTII